MNPVKIRESVYLSVVIPVFNEEKRIGPTIERVCSFLAGRSFTSEIVIADDGSRDASLEIARNQLGKFPHQIVKNPVNQGKGSAVRRGMLAARGELRLFSDADMSTPIEEAEKFIRAHQEGVDVVLGSRALSSSNVTLRQNALRELMGRVFNGMARVLAFRGISDSQCGFKSFTCRAAVDLFSRQKLNGFSFDAEIVFLAQRCGYKIIETPVTWQNSPQSRVRLFKDPWLMFMDLFKIRWLHRGL